MHKFTALETELVRAWQTGAPDAHGQTPERTLSDGAGNPCRHCLKDIAEGAGMLILAHRPFAGLHPYAECGPIFICADSCDRAPADRMPPILKTSPNYLIKGYNAKERIVYGTGQIVPAHQIRDKIATTLADTKVAFLHVRSARNTCYQVRIDRS